MMEKANWILQEDGRWKSNGEVYLRIKDGRLYEPENKEGEKIGYPIEINAVSK